MILMEEDIDLQRNNEQLKAIRRGEWTEERLRTWCADKESQLEKVYAESKLRATPDEPKIRSLLVNCLEEHYGSLEDCLVNPDRAVECSAEHPGGTRACEGLFMSDVLAADVLDRLQDAVNTPPLPADLRHDQRSAPVRLSFARLGL